MESSRAHYEANEWEQIEREELEHLFPDRTDRRRPKLAGLAISGGGIRSASFGLGVLQALVHDGLLEKFHYLSTVSGGGYIGSALTWFLHRGLPSASGHDIVAGTKPSNFPLGRDLPGQTPGGRDGNKILDFIRQHGNYLIPGSGLGPMSVIGVVIRSVSVALAIYLGLLVGLMSMGLVLDDWIQSTQLLEPLPLEPLDELRNPTSNYYSPLLALALLLLLGFVIVSLGLSLLHSVLIQFGLPGGSYPLRTWGQRFSGMLVGLVVFSAALGLIPILYNHLDAIGAAVSSLASTGVGAALLSAALGKLRGPSEPPSRLASVLLYLATGLIVSGLVLGAYGIAMALHGSSSWVPSVIFAFAAVSGAFININYLGMHRMYRDRLMELFMPNLDSAAAGKWGAANDADELLIADICHQPNRQPYHLINTNVVLVDSDDSKYRGRGGDNFVISRLFCGSAATGWRRSGTWKVSAARGMTLATATAISGAAANPNTGLAGAGAMRSRVVSALMSVLNLRLGYWVPNPRAVPRRRNPNYLIPGLFSILGLGLDERRPMVELTDGGHFENLALYELIRRRVDLIVVCDGGSDPKFTFEDLANVVERVRVDFGVKIRLPDHERSMLIPQHPPAESLDPEGKLRLAARGYAVAKIIYPPDPERGLEKSTGKLILLKTTLVAGLPSDLYSYKLAHPRFPDESTADQFFDEKQVEVYRELGYTICKQMLEREGHMELEVALVDDLADTEQLACT